MTKKQIKDLAATYNYYNEIVQNTGNQQAIDFLDGMTRTLVITGDLKKVANEAYKINKTCRQLQALENLEFNIDFYFGKDKYDVTMFDYYYDEVDFLDIPQDAKTAIKVNIERLKEAC